MKRRVRRAQLLSRWPERGRQGVLGSRASSAPHSPQAAQGGCKHWPGAFSWHRCPGGHWAFRAADRPASRQGFLPHHTWAGHARGEHRQGRRTRPQSARPATPPQLPGCTRPRERPHQSRGGPENSQAGPRALRPEPGRASVSQPHQEGLAVPRGLPPRAPSRAPPQAPPRVPSEVEDGRRGGTPGQGHCDVRHRQGCGRGLGRRAGPDGAASPPHLAAVPAAIQAAAAVAILHPGAPVWEGHTLRPARPPEHHHCGVERWGVGGGGQAPTKHSRALGSHTYPPGTAGRPGRAGSCSGSR